MSLVVDPGWLTKLIYFSCDESFSRRRYDMIESLSYHITATFSLTYRVPLLSVFHLRCLLSY